MESIIRIECVKCGYVFSGAVEGDRPRTFSVQICQRCENITKQTERVPKPGVDLDYLYKQVDALGVAMFESGTTDYISVTTLNDIARYINLFRWGVGIVFETKGDCDE